jgi:phosphoribosyl-ATP pyrophosphohydrolase
MAKPTKKTPPKPKPKLKSKPKPKAERGTKKGGVKKKVVGRRFAKPTAQPMLAGAPLLPPLPLAAGVSSAVLDRLWSVVMSRRDADPTLSHSARLLSRGSAKVAQKFGEEAVECLIEATLGNHHALVAESADVLYHLIVMWVDAGVRPEEVWAELHRREGVSGIAEKAARARALPLILGRGTAKIP